MRCKHERSRNVKEVPWWHQACPIRSENRASRASSAMPILFNSMQSAPKGEIWARYPFMLKMGTPDFCGVETALIGPIWPVNGGSPNANTENSYPPGPL